MTPYYQDDSCTIYHGDYREWISSVPQYLTLDAVITDPPFGIGFNYGKDGHNDSAKEYESVLLPIVKWAQEHALGAMFWQAMPNCDKWHKWFPSGFRIMAAAKGFVQFRPTPIQYSWDPIIAFGEFTSEPIAGSRDYHIQLLAPFGSGRERIDHPCPRPIEQVIYFVSISGAKTILDPFMGSGTTLVAAKQLGRKAIGIEIEEKYCEIAAKRLINTVTPLIPIEPPTPNLNDQQPSLL